MSGRESWEGSLSGSKVGGDIEDVMNATQRGSFRTSPPHLWCIGELDQDSLTFRSETSKEMPTVLLCSLL